MFLISFFLIRQIKWFQLVFSDRTKLNLSNYYFVFFDIFFISFLIFWMLSPKFVGKIIEFHIFIRIFGSSKTASDHSDQRWHHAPLFLALVLTVRFAFFRLFYVHCIVSKSWSFDTLAKNYQKYEQNWEQRNKIH